jgi:hypothetical protein
MSESRIIKEITLHVYFKEGEESNFLYLDEGDRYGVQKW